MDGKSGKIAATSGNDVAKSSKVGGKSGKGARGDTGHFIPPVD
jgi:hypothetical protein